MGEFGFSATFQIVEGSEDALQALMADMPTGHQVTIDIKAKRRTVWEWLTRKPRHAAQRIVIPHAILTDQEPQDD